MAIAKTVEAADGQQILGAYWAPAQINIAVLDGSGQITFYAHVSTQAKAEGKAPISGAVKTYPFTRQQFMAAQAMLLTDLIPEGITPTTRLYDVLGHFAYSIARQTKDTPVIDATGKPVLGPDVPAVDAAGKPLLDAAGKQLMNPGAPLLQSFFEGGTNV